MKIIRLIIISIIISSTFISCDKIEEPYKTKIDKPVTEKNVLLEDYTGHKCSNCPNAHDIANELTDAYGEENLIVVAIHADYFAWVFPAPLDYDFQTTAGTEYFGHFSIGSTPNGLVDRKNNGGIYVTAPRDWGTQVAKQFEEENVVNIEILSELNDNKLSGTVNLDFISDVNLQTNLQIWITEDSIIKPQTLAGAGEMDLEYVHNHVLRGAVNGTWGDELPSANYSSEDNVSISFSDYQLGEDWVAKNLSLIAYLYDQESKKVLQIEKIKISE